MTTVSRDLTIDRDSQITGYVKGNIIVNESVTLLIHGEVVGDILIKSNAKVCIHGAVMGDITNDRGILMVLGILSGKVFDPN